MSSKNDVNSNQFGFALEVLKLLAEKPLRKTELENLLRDKDISCEDLPQKITRVIGKLRDCGFEIRSAPNRPYELVESVFPVILSEEQRQALAMAAHFLADMGFSAQASQIYRIGNISKASQSPSVTVDFHPPVDYSEDTLDDTVRQLQKRLQQKRRFVIWYRNSKGEERSWDLDKSQFRLHNGILYLFALVPDCHTYHIQTRPNVEQNFIFRIDRIVRIGAASHTPWTYSQFPTLDIRYRLTGALAVYKPRRPHEFEQSREGDTDFRDILTREDCLFWFRQRMLQYGASARILDPLWLAQDICNELKKAYTSYC
jgi:predicted DNA-binding transcriptional regulator YafY